MSALRSAPRRPLPTSPSPAARAVLAAAALLAAACADGATDKGCHFDSDCGDGVCVDGQCTADPCPTCEDASPISGDPDDGVPPSTCTVDGRVLRAELVLGPGVGVPFRTTGLEDLHAVDLAGTPGDGGMLAWDLTGAVGATDEARFTQLFDPAEAPVSADFAGVDYIVPLPGTPSLLAFYDLDDAALRLLGIADAAGAYTHLTYDPPVEVLRFPLQVGDRWQARATARGALFGASVQVTDEFSTEVRGRGVVTLPAGDIPALELLTVQTRHFDSAGFSQVSTTVDFLAECGGYVAKAVSAEGESGLFERARLVSVMLPQTCAADADCGTGGACVDARCAPRATFAEAVPPAPACRADGDFVITDAEMPVEAGLAGRFRLSAPGAEIAVDLDGEVADGEHRLWRFDADALGTDERLERTLDPAEFWFGDHFPGATYAAVLDAASGTHAVFERVPGELRILGLASRAADRTLLVYETPVAAMRFPLRVGDAWSADTPASGRLEGQEIALAMHYDFRVDAAGTIRLPAGDVPVLRLRIDSRQQVEGAAFALARSTVLYVAECLGGVARVVSQVNETEREFTVASEVSRLTVPQCLTSLQCPAEAHCVDARCEGASPPPPDADSGVAPPPGDDGGVSPPPDTDGGIEPPPDPDAGVPLCNPQGDYTIDRAEFPLSAGLTAHFRVAESEAGLPVDLNGTDCAEGTCWDFSADRDGDTAEVVELIDPAGLWFADDFPDATYVSVMDRERGWLGAFRLTDAGLELLGTASGAEGEMKTTYDPPVQLYRFPLHPGDHWTVETTQSGYMNYGIPVFTNDTYDIHATAHGEVETPQGTFRAVQVVTRVSQAVPFTLFGSDRIVHTFVSECFGIIARAVSLSGEDMPFFARASRLERLAPAR